MNWQRAIAAAAVSTLVVPSTDVLAKDLPIWMPPDALAAAASESGTYVWIDGAGHSLRLPGFALGFKTFDANDLDTGTTNRFDPQPTGGGFRGALGYVLPAAAVPSGLGSRVRVEINGSYVRASDSQAGLANPVADEIGIQFVNGVVIPNGFVCNGVIGVCSVAATLGTSYRQWDFGAKVASDFVAAGSLTLTPSLAIFGGTGNVDQNLAETLTQTAIGIRGRPVTVTNYNAATALHWTDVGVKFGLDANVPVTNWLSLGLGGSVGFAHRDASLSASDSCPDLFCANGAFNANGDLVALTSSAVSQTAAAIPLLANAEARVTIRPTRQLAVRGFVGLTYDSSVPGVSTPVLVGGNTAPIATTPAGIKFGGETSWYAGGGIALKFAP